MSLLSQLSNKKRFLFVNEKYNPLRNINSIYSDPIKAQFNFGKVQMLNGNFYASCQGIVCKIEKNIHLHLFHGDLIDFKVKNYLAFPSKILYKNNFVCGVLSEDGKFLFPHGISGFKIPVKSQKIEFPSPNPVYIASLHRDQDSYSCDDLKFLGDNYNIETQEKCLYISEGLGDSIDQVYSSIDFLQKTEIPFSDYQKYYDMSNHITFCIDPKNSKDADDAISIIKLDTDVYEIGIHVVDIESLLRNKSYMIYPTFRRTRTYFLIDSCLPMFPKDFAASSSFCVGEKKPCVSVVFKFNKNKIFDLRLVNGLINVNHSISCQDAEKLININDEKEFNKLTKLINPIPIESWLSLKKLLTLSHRLNDDRIERFNTFKIDIPDPQCVLGNDSKYPKVKNMIENYMLFANFKISEFLKSKMDENAIFRTNTPRNKLTEERLFNEMIILKNVFDDEYFVNYLILRNSTVTEFCRYRLNTNHFLLGFPSYINFTSPIRRLPDVINHFIVKSYISEEKVPLNIINNLNIVIKLSNLNSKFSKILFLKCVKVHLNKRLREGSPMICTGYFFNNLIYIPSLNLSVKLESEYDLSFNIMKVEVELIPSMKDGFMDVNGRIRKCISKID